MLYFIKKKLLGFKYVEVDDVNEVGDSEVFRVRISKEELPYIRVGKYSQYYLARTHFGNWLPSHRFRYV